MNKLNFQGSALSVRLSLATFVCVIFATLASAQQVYRYVDKDGVTILNSTIPASYVGAGYEVLNSTGQVIKVVAPTEIKKPKTASERKAEAEAEEVAKAEKAMIRKSDKILLSSYSQVSEIERRRDRKIDSLSAQIKGIEFDQRHMTKDLEKIKGERAVIAARVDAAKAPSERLLKELNKLDEKIKSTQKMTSTLTDQLSSRNQELEDIRQEYSLKIERFVQLKQVKLDTRRTSLDLAE